jgi:hypothetical protein
MEKKVKKGYLVWLEYLEDSDDSQYIGVFSTRKEAEEELKKQKEELIEDGWFYTQEGDCFKQWELHIQEVNLFEKKPKVYVVVSELGYDGGQSEITVCGTYTTKAKAKQEVLKRLKEDKENASEKWEDEVAYEREINEDGFSIWLKNDYSNDHYSVQIYEKELE